MLPEYDDDKHLVDDFMNYFIKKIKYIRSELGHFVNINHILNLAKVKSWKNLIP